MITTGDEAKITDSQHRVPCHDCPWRRKSIPGWLGEKTVSEWISAVKGEALIECHALRGENGPHQCAGAAIYRANICKLPRDPEVMRLPADRKSVFGFGEFEKHHNRSR